MPSARLLLLEDDTSLGETILSRLKKEAYEVSWVKNLAEARDSIKVKNFDLLILDVGLPDGSGFDIAEELQGRFPVIFLTALNSAENRLRGYELGANEYIPKPFHFKELLIRIEKTLGSEFSEGPKSYSFEDFIINLDSMTVEQNGQLFYPSARDFSVLTYLITCFPNVVSREELLDKYWGSDSFPTNRTVDNSILRIRQFLGEKAQDYLKSVRGIGYQWIQEPKK
ncbi:MAG: DNA-binding response regulator [Halobacteriovorax sp.]|nr:DNA-binding response regulator [Halobacteriovorax sp.]|tara:strand:+ start:147808 stop:148485 length:678 start_codon:yes stop_codon:yes gene_type:complete